MQLQILKKPGIFVQIFFLCWFDFLVYICCFHFQPKIWVSLSLKCSLGVADRFIMFIALEMNNPGSIGYRHSDLFVFSVKQNERHVSALFLRVLSHFNISLHKNVSTVLCCLFIKH